jgi:hypothetical protein
MSAFGGKADITLTCRFSAQPLRTDTRGAFKNAQLVAIHTDGWAHFTESGENLAKAFGALGLGGRLRALAMARLRGLSR